MIKVKTFIVASGLFLSSVTLVGQEKQATISGAVYDAQTKAELSFVNAGVYTMADTILVSGTFTDESGRFVVTNILPGKYLLGLSYTGFRSQYKEILVGQLSQQFDLGRFYLSVSADTLAGVTVTAAQQGVSSKMDRKSYQLGDNVSQTGSSVLQAIKNLPGITITRDGKVEIRGSDKVMVLIDGKQTALSGFGNQAGLDNIPASAVERIEIINNPSARYDAGGNAGIVNIIFKKEKQDGLNGKIGLSTGLGAVGEKKENLPGIRPQYSSTPKVNPSLSMNYRHNRVNVFLQADGLWEKTLNRNEFTDRFYDNGEVIKQQVKRNRITTEGTAKLGLDWNAGSHDIFTISGLFSREKVEDYGDIPYYDQNLRNRARLWQFFEDEVITAATTSASWQHKFSQPGHQLAVSLNYTFNREDEKYFFHDFRSTYTGKDTFMLIADQHVTDVSIDYVKPLRRGRLESGVKFRNRYIPTNMQFFPGENSPLDTDAGGWANYREVIPALYSNYVLETNRLEVEAGLRLEYVDLEYEVNPDHNTYKSDGYTYTEPFPSVRVGYKLSDNSKVSLFYNRRVDRPDEGDIRIFPKYDEPEILKVGNPMLKPQFTSSVEIGYKTNWSSGSFYSAVYQKMTKGTISRIGTTVPNDLIIYNIYQNTGSSVATGAEIVLQQKIGVYTLNANANLYRSKIEAFVVTNQYPRPSVYSAEEYRLTSGNLKLNNQLQLPKRWDVQIAAIYLGRDIIPQGRIGPRFSIDGGVKKVSANGKYEFFANASDILNTLQIRREIRGANFNIVTTDYYETQVFRVGFSLKF